MLSHKKHFHISETYVRGLIKATVPYPCLVESTQLLCLQVYSILRHVAEVLEYSKDEQLESLYLRTAWVFDEKYKRPGYGAYDAFKQAVS